MPDALTGLPSPIATSGAISSVERSDTKAMGKDTFLKLLVAQMRYQDPANPADTNQLMAQTATFSQVEKLEEMAKQNGAMLALQRSSSAGALVGRTVTWTDTQGAAQTGVVSSVRLATDTSEAVATIGGKPVPMGRITEIATTPSSGTSSSPAS